MKRDAPTANLTRTMIRGSLWLFSASGLLAIVSFACNWALGWWLSKEDFGVYALAIACATLLQVFRDGGVQYWLARQSPEDFQRSRAAAFWLTMLASGMVTSLLLAVAPLLGRLYQSEDVAKLVMLLGLATPIQSLAIVSDAKLQVDLRFRELSVLRMIAGVLRYSLTMVLAACGLGPYSFVWPLFVVGFVQAGISYSWTGIRPRQLPWNGRETARVAAWSKWAMTGTFATAILQQIDYVTLGLIARGDAGKAVVGTYFFAFLFAMQPATILGQSLRKVFVPAFAATKHDSQRRYRGALQAVTWIGLVISPVILLFALLSAEIVKLLWGDKWLLAIPAIQVLALVVPIHFMVDVTRMITQADGRFGLWTAAVFLRGLSIAAAVVVAGFLGGVSSAAVVAVCVATMIAIGGMLESTVLLNRADLPSGSLVKRFFLPYACCCVAGFVAQEFAPPAESFWLTALSKTLIYLVLLTPMLVLVCGAAFRDISLIRRPNKSASAASSVTLSNAVSEWSKTK